MDKNLDISELELNQNLIKMDTLINMLSKSTNDLISLNKEFNKLMTIYSFSLPRSFGEKTFNQLDYIISIQSQLIMLYRKMLPGDWLDTLNFKLNKVEMSKHKCNFCALEFNNEEELNSHRVIHKRRWEEVPEEEKKIGIEYYKGLIKNNLEKLNLLKEETEKSKILKALKVNLAKKFNLIEVPEEILNIKIKDVK